MAEYRGYGSSSGEPALVDMLNDVTALMDASGVPPEEIVLFGRSIGSIYAIHGASVRPVAGLIIESGIADVRERLLMRVTPEEVGSDQASFDSACTQALNHQEKLAKYAGPVLVMHTRNDGLVDLNHAERNHEWATGPKRLLVFEEGSHNSIIGTNALAYFQAIGEFVASL